MPGWEVSQRQHCLVHDDGSLVLYVDRGATALSVYVRYLSTDVFEGRAACLRLQRLANQGEDVVPIQPTGKEIPGARVCPLSRFHVKKCSGSSGKAPMRPAGTFNSR